MVIVLPGERPTTWNHIYAGKHYMFRKELADKVHKIVQQEMGKMSDLPKFQVPVVIEIVAYMKSPICDADNVCTKMYIDGLKHYLVKKTGTRFYKEEQKHWVIEDDNPTYVAAVASGVIKTKDDPRVEIYIKPYENPV